MTALRSRHRFIPTIRAIRNAGLTATRRLGLLRLIGLVWIGHMAWHASGALVFARALLGG